MTSNNKEAGISWLIEQKICRDDLSEADRSMQLTLIASTFHKNEVVLDYDYDPIFGTVLMSSNDLEIVVGSGLNAILSDYFSGGGTLHPKHTKHLIMLLLLIKNAVSAGINAWISLCDLDGGLIEYDSLFELFTLLEPLGFNKDELRQFAEAVGLCEQVIDLSALNIVDQEDYFF